MAECAHKWMIEGSWSKEGAHYAQQCARCGRRELLNASQFVNALQRRAGRDVT